MNLRRESCRMDLADNRNEIQVSIKTANAAHEGTPNPESYLALIESLGHTSFTQDLEILFQHAQEISSSSDSVERINHFAGLIISTRGSLSDPELDTKLVIAASNALSILNYGSLCELFNFRFQQIGDFSHCRLPYANLNMAVLTGCNFDYADLCNASMFCTHTVGATFRHANLANVRTFQSKELDDLPTLHPTLPAFNFAAFSHDSRCVAVSFRRNTVRVWSTATYECLAVLSFDANVTAMAFARDGATLAVGTEGPLIYICDLSSARCIHELRGHRKAITALSYSVDGSFLASASADGSIRVWRIEAGDYKHEITFAEEHRTASLAFSKDSKNLTCGGWRDEVYCWSLTAQRQLFHSNVNRCVMPVRVASSSDGRFLASYFEDNALAIWDVYSGELKDELYREPVLSTLVDKSMLTGEEEIPTAPSNHKGCEKYGLNVWEIAPHFKLDLAFPRVQVYVKATTLDGKYFMSCATSPTNTRIVIHDAAALLHWSYSLAKHRAIVDKPYFSRVTTTAFAVSPDGHHLTVSGKSRNGPDDRIEATSVTHDTSSGHATWIASTAKPHEKLSYSRDGRFIVGYNSNIVSVWYTMSKELKSSLHTLISVGTSEQHVPLGALEQVALSPDGSRLALLRQKQLILVDASTGRFDPASHCYALRSGIFQDVSFAPDGRTLAASFLVTDAHRLGVLLWSVADAKVVECRYAQLQKYSREQSCRLSWSVDGSMLVTAGPDNYARVWTVKDQHLEGKMVLKSHRAPVSGTMVTADARAIVTSSYDGTLCLWDAETGENKFQVSVGDEIHFMEHSANGVVFATGCNNHSLVYVWHIVHAADTYQIELANVIGLPQQLDARGCFSDARLSPAIANQLSDKSKSANMLTGDVEEEKESAEISLSDFGFAIENDPNVYSPDLNSSADLQPQLQHQPAAANPPLNPSGSFSVSRATAGLRPAAFAIAPPPPRALGPNPQLGSTPRPAPQLGLAPPPAPQLGLAPRPAPQLGLAPPPPLQLGLAPRLATQGLLRAVPVRSAFDVALEAAQNGETKQMFDVATCYLRGDGVDRDERLAYEWFLKAAEQGDSKAQFRVGLCFLDGTGVERDAEKAWKWFLRSVEYGDASLQFAVAGLYKRGEGTRKNPELAFEWYYKAAAQNHPEALYEVGWAYLHGLGVERNPQLALEWILKAADRSDKTATFQLAQFYERGEFVERSPMLAQYHYTWASKYGVAEALIKLGLNYKNWFGRCQSAEWAFEQFDSAADSSPYAQALLGRCYRDGFGAERDEKQAVRHFQQSADKGEPLGQFYLGLAYLLGQGVEQDQIQAWNWIENAIKQNNPEVQCEFGDLYRMGKGVEQSHEQAFEWYSKAAKQGYPRGQYEVAYAHLYAHGASADPNLAVDILRQLAQEDYEDAQFQLGQCYERGVGIAPNSRAAFGWYLKAANNGHLGAQCCTGICYFEGIGTEIDCQLAFAWLREPANHGDALAMAYLGLCFSDTKRVHQIPELSRLWLRKSAEAGNPIGQFHLGLSYLHEPVDAGNEKQAWDSIIQAVESGDPHVLCNFGELYAEGKHVERNDQTAVEWYRKAAAQGYARAQYKLGCAYFDGLGVTQDTTLGLEWLSRAAEQDYEPAKLRLGL